MKPLLFETIKLAGGEITNSEYHNERMNRTRKELFNTVNNIDIKKCIVFPADYIEKEYKCRIFYTDKIESVDYSEYKRKIINKLKIIHCDDINYSYKYADRTVFSDLLNKAGCGESEDILIIKDNLLTDVSFGNAALFNGKGWETPKNPLLRGIQREKLIKMKLLIPADIRISDLKKYSKIKIINAMLNFEESAAIPIESVVF